MCACVVMGGLALLLLWPCVPAQHRCGRLPQPARRQGLPRIASASSSCPSSSSRSFLLPPPPAHPPDPPPPIATLPCPAASPLQGARFAGKSIKELRSLGSDGWFYPLHAAQNTSLREIIHDGFLHPKDAK